jgi:hypothetical protein
LVAAGAGALVLIRELTQSKRQKHDRVVERTAEEMVRKGYAVAADVPGWPRPPLLNGRRVDVYAQRDRRVELIEVEHVDTLDTSHTREQVADLADACVSRRGHRLRVKLT